MRYILKNAAKNPEKVFFFSDNCIWIGIVKLSLWRTRYFSSEANVLTSSPKILHVNKRDFFLLNFLGGDRQICKRVCGVDFNSAWESLPCCLSKGPLKRDFFDIYLTTFWESVISQIQKLWGSSFLKKMFKIEHKFQKCSKKFRFLFLR